MPLKIFFYISAILLVAGCKSFNYGYTHTKALNRYNLITGNKQNFGNKRLEYNRAVHRGSQLSDYVGCFCLDQELPDFIFEYQTASRTDGIKLYYAKRDSVYIFESPKRFSALSNLKEARKMDDSERETYSKLKKGE